jgi:hypothetical protein
LLGTTQELNAELEDSHAKAKELHKAQESLAGAFHLAHTRTTHHTRNTHTHTHTHTHNTTHERLFGLCTHACHSPIMAEREHQLVSLQKDKEVELQGLHDTLILMRNEAQVSSPSVQCASCVVRVVRRRVQRAVSQF